MGPSSDNWAGVDMMWLEHIGANRALAIACSLGTAIVVHPWRLTLAAVATTVREARTPGATGISPVSRAWLRENEAEDLKHQDVR